MERSIVRFTMVGQNAFGSFESQKIVRRAETAEIARAILANVICPTKVLLPSPDIEGYGGLPFALGAPFGEKKLGKIC